MGSAHTSQVSPGLCPPEGCPPPTRIECIVVDKVYDSCFQLDELSRETSVDFGGLFSVGDIINCEKVGSVTCTELSRVEVGDGFFSITILVTVTVLLTNPNDPTETVTRVFNFVKTVTLCCPEGVSPDCSESTLTTCTCIVTDVSAGYVPTITVSCNLQICLVIKCILAVQLLVPSYGFCIPAPCIAIPGVCPPVPPAQCF